MVSTFELRASNQMGKTFQFSMQQELDIRPFAERVKALSREEAINELKNLYRTMVVTEEIYKGFLKDAIRQ